ncbi:hypothetical protein ACH5RR_000703 [Cinchona calisaya]|uniref:Uncharacterized protein n=1 Tax=Cinchona calisaya TaxID=153742 RepID=A0ABD3B1B7_9GENT
MIGALEDFDTSLLCLSDLEEEELPLLLLPALSDEYSDLDDEGKKHFKIHENKAINVKYYIAVVLHNMLFVDLKDSIFEGFSNLIYGLRESSIAIPTN